MHIENNKLSNDLMKKLLKTESNKKSVTDNIFKNTSAHVTSFNDIEIQCLINTANSSKKSI